LILASASPARLRLLREAGFAPDVVVSGVDEDDVAGLASAEIALVLAERKAAAVAAQLGIDELASANTTIVVGCDSVLDLGGRPYGKPASADEAVQRWRAMRGTTGVLLTGHCVIATSDHAGGDASDDGRRASAVAATTVRFGCPSDAEIDAYVATGEPLGVAGAFTLQGRSAPFIDGIDGDPGNVIGLSLPLFRDLLRQIAIEVTSLWT